MLVPQDAKKTVSASALPLTSVLGYARSSDSAGNCQHRRGRPVGFSGRSALAVPPNEARPFPKEAGLLSCHRFSAKNGSSFAIA